jgi:ribosomal protein S18 acetylase RimI-like enzyme
VTAAPVSVICRGRERARTSPWRGAADTAMLMPAPEGPLLSVTFVHHCLETLTGQGFRRVMTAALSPLEQAGFLAAGFQVEQDLCLLAVELDDRLPPVPPGPRLRRGSRRRPGEVLAVDHSAFPEFWRFDELALDDALCATPAVRYRVAGEEPDRLDGYAVCGRAARRGYVQRLAVRPDCQGRGIGRRLLLDGLHWMARRGATSAYVNTQRDNEAALALYRAVGFRDEPVGLAVLSAGLS